MSADWLHWHQPYLDPTSPLSRRLATVQQHLVKALDSARTGTIRLVSLCAGQGHDVLGVLSTHPRAGDVVARLIELDPRNVLLARASARDLGLAQVDIVCADASSTRAIGAGRVDVVMLCGIFGNISDAHVEGTIGQLPTLCAPRASVIWTRHRREPDLTPLVRSWFEATGLESVAFDAPDDALFAVGTQRFVGTPRPRSGDVQLFDFLGDGALGHS